MKFIPLTQEFIQYVVIGCIIIERDFTSKDEPDKG